MVVEGIMDKHFVNFFLKLDQWLRRKCHLKIFLELWQPFCSAERNHLCNFSRGYWGTILWNCCEFKPVVQMFKRFLIWSSGDPPVQWSGTICAISKRASWGICMWSYMTFGPVVQEMLLKEKVHGRKLTDEGHRLITIAHLEPSAQVS